MFKRAKIRIGDFIPINIQNISDVGIKGVTLKSNIMEYNSKNEISWIYVVRN